MANPHEWVWIRIRVRRRFREALERVAGSKRYASFVKAAMSHAMLRNPSVEDRFRDLSITPRGTSSVEQFLEWLLARQPVVGDLVGNDGELDPQVRRALRRALPHTQARRLERVLRGHKYEEISLDEDCSRQAVHASVQRALRDLASSREFLEALCDAVPESGLTPEQLMEAADGGR